MSLLQRLEKQKSLQQEQAEQQELSLTRRDLRQQNRGQLQELTLNLHKKVISKLNDTSEDSKENPDLLAQKIEALVNELLDEENENIARTQRQLIVAEIIDETIGFGPITPLLNDPNISEVMVNGPNQVYVERDGKLVLTGVKFRDNAHVLHIIEKIVAPIGRRIDESMPMVDARLPDGSRVNAIIPPLALNGPTVTIRKFSKDPYTVDDLIKFGTITPQMAQFLEACVKSRLNIVVSGGTGSGKTTTLNVLSSFIPADERIVTIEDAAELQLRQEHVITLESRPPNIEGKGAITIRDLVRNSLRMRPERIVVGEVRSGEALDMLQAMNTGHDGSLTTGHANAPRDMLSRLETMVLMAGMDLPVRAIREQISSAIDLIIQQNRFRDGSRRITHITEVQGMEGEVIILQDLFTFRQTGVDENGRIKGSFQSTGIRPKFIHRLESSGIKLPADIFSPSIF
ncbi:type II secretion system protein E [Desulforamulus profundi]|uniref:Type II secretion system protein E n=1 Tax=Desulforamulus profundi TaxID=1383067 RepID=A0A2C6L3K9_9FIRM|nr:CpaF family protein [Desulforamulus profundi]PHJ39211.1 type II secretion system protein E [Desulforamulus profundi]